MIVVDASAALSAIYNAGPAREVLPTQQLHAPHLVDIEVAVGLRRSVAAGTLEAAAGWQALDVWRRLGLTRYPHIPQLERVWQLRDDLTPYDAVYVALAEVLGCALVTADARLTRAPGVRCAITLVPR